ncbi:deoxynucleoside triphosphate triphosphohydrolase SAMHD1-like isoform X3 [Portunus trituberculatus]|uniref:deoxynucleoside triphosphate triphosphohydrolase SAMHD1-like isoform X3 n=1 Tax=Portunus trituberculatus TaxID=210409 RepID=UPI001E1D21F0|nr:deoxynucleoside triphosphate triphosphohydrolase SAMHD1-like isoform X3 [Portunus trituberculatus]
MMEEPGQWRMHQKTFQDAVHGAITLHPLCVKVIDTPQFQRLRFIKALGTCYFVFPAATHNRFEHCLGVCYLAGQLVCALQSRQPELDISEADILCVQLAGLCHDLGHGPFSHLWEQFVSRARPEKHWVVTFDYHRIIQFSRVIPVGEETQICIRDKESNNVYDMFHARRVLHRTAYKHRVVQIIDNMFVDALLYADKHICYLGSNGVKYPLADVCDDMMAYSNLTDWVFHQILLDERDHPDLLHAKKILSSIFRRQLYLCVGHTKPNNPATTFKNLEEALKRNIPKNSTLTPEDLIVTQVELNYGMEDQNPVEMVYFYNKTSPMKTKKIKKEESILLPESFQERTFRILCRSNEEDKFKHAQRALMAACQELNMKEELYDELIPPPFSPVKNHRWIED